jgi:hypothetical protein
MDPTLVKTVSYFKLSTLVVNPASALVIKESFLQEEAKKQSMIARRPTLVCNLKKIKPVFVIDQN